MPSQEELKKEVARLEQRLLSVYKSALFRDGILQGYGNAENLFSWAGYLGIASPYLKGPLTAASIISDVAAKGRQILGLDDKIRYRIAEEGAEFVDLLKQMGKIDRGRALDFIRDVAPNMPDPARRIIIKGVAEILEQVTQEKVEPFEFMQFLRSSDRNITIPLDPKALDQIQQDIKKTLAQPPESGGLNKQEWQTLGDDLMKVSKIIEQEISGVRNDIKGISKAQRQQVLETKEVKEQVEKLKSILKQKKQAEDNAQRWTEVKEASQFATWLGQVTGNRFLSRVGVAGQGVAQVGTAMVKLSGLKAAAAAAGEKLAIGAQIGPVGAVIMGVFTVVQAFAADNGDGEEQAFEQLAELMQTIREEMHQRFDGIEDMLLENRVSFLRAFNGVFEQLNDIQAFQQYVKNRQGETHGRLSHVHGEMREGFRALHKAELNRIVLEIYNNSSDYLTQLTLADFGRRRSALESWFMNESTSLYNGFKSVAALEEETVDDRIILSALKNTHGVQVFRQLGLLAWLAQKTVPEGNWPQPDNVIHPGVFRIALQPYVHLLTCATVAGRDRQQEQRSIKKIKGQIELLAKFVLKVHRYDQGRALFFSLVGQYVETLDQVNDFFKTSLEQTRQKLNKDHNVDSSLELLKLDENLDETVNRLKNSREKSWQKCIEWPEIRGERDKNPEYGYKHAYFVWRKLEEKEHPDPAGREKGIYVYYSERHDKVYALVVHQKDKLHERLDLTDIANNLTPTEQALFTKADSLKNFLSVVLCSGRSFDIMPDSRQPLPQYHIALGKLLDIIQLRWKHAPGKYEPWLSPGAKTMDGQGRLLNRDWPEVKDGNKLGKVRFGYMRSESSEVHPLICQINNDPFINLARHYSDLDAKFKFHLVILQRHNEEALAHYGIVEGDFFANDTVWGVALANRMTISLAYKQKSKIVSQPLMRTFFFASPSLPPIKHVGEDIFTEIHSYGEYASLSKGIKTHVDILLPKKQKPTASNEAKEEKQERQKQKSREKLTLAEQLGLPEHLSSFLQTQQRNWATQTLKSESKLWPYLQKLTAVKRQLFAFFHLLGMETKSLDRHFPEQTNFQTTLEKCQEGMVNPKALLQLSSMPRVSELQSAQRVENTESKDDSENTLIALQRYIWDKVSQHPRQARNNSAVIRFTDQALGRLDVLEKIVSQLEFPSVAASNDEETKNLLRQVQAENKTLREGQAELLQQLAQLSELVRDLKAERAEAKPADRPSASSSHFFPRQGGGAGGGQSGDSGARPASGPGAC